MKALIDKLSASQTKIVGAKAGQVTIGTVSSNTTKSKDIILSEPMENANYSVVVTSTSGGSMWAQTKFSVRNKTNSGFMISAHNIGGSTSASLSANYIVIPYTE